jgi:RNA-binding protein
MITLTGKQRSYLRGLGHALVPVIQVGKDGATDALVEEIKAQLVIHELVKLHLGRNVPEGRHDLGDELAVASDSSLVQVLGRMILLYRPREEKPAIKLPIKGGPLRPPSLPPAGKKPRKAGGPKARAAKLAATREAKRLRKGADD